MSSYINNVCNEKSYTSLITSEYKSKNKDAQDLQSKIKDTQESQNKDKETQKLQKKKQMISEKEGNYYCTYMVDDEGQKTLIKKVPITQEQKQNSLQNSIESNETNFSDYNVKKNGSTTFEYKQQLHMEATHRKNLREVMDMLKGNIGIQNKLNKHYGFDL